MRRIIALLLTFLSGILLSLPWVFPRSGWVLFFAFIPLMLVSQNPRSRVFGSISQSNFLLPFSTFLIWNLLSTWWIGYVSFWGMLFIASANAGLMAVTWWGSCKIKQIAKVSGNFALIVFWVCFDFLSHKGMLPWPWLALGNGFAGLPRLMQWFEFTGVLGGSLWIMISNVIGFELVIRLVEKHQKKLRWALAWAAVIVVPVALSLKLYYDYSKSNGKLLRVVVLQPNVDPYTEKFSETSYSRQVQLLDSLLVSANSGMPDLLLAPETALPEMNEDSLLVNRHLQQLSESLKTNQKGCLVIGAITSKAENVLEPTGLKRYNSAVLIGASSNLQISHKTKLVAGVERQPFREYFSFLPSFLLNVDGNPRELTSGQKPRVLKTGLGASIAPVICFESVFGDFVRETVADGANCIAVLTNDGWWKGASGARQHFLYSGIRAIETRRNVIRSSNTGISGCFNSRGDVIVKSGQGLNCTVDSEILLNEELTFYVVYGDYLGWGSMLLAVLIVVYTAVGNKKSALIRM